MQPDLNEAVDLIRYWHRQRVFAMEQRKRSDLALGAFLRTQLGWSRDLPKDETATINAKAAAAIAIGEKIVKQDAKASEKRKAVVGASGPFFMEWSGLIIGSLRGRSHFVAIEDKAAVEMDRLARLLPVAPWFLENVFRTEAKSLGIIIAETGDLSSYANPGKVWKRMGLAVMGDVRQGGLRKGAAADEWIAHGYSAKRRSLMFVIGDALLKGNKHYRAIYHARKEYERAKAAERGMIVAPAAKIPAKRKAEFISDGHIHKRSQRYMEKRLLKHLWQAWRQATERLPTMLKMPAADDVPHPAHGDLKPLAAMPDASRSAIHIVSSDHAMPSASIPEHSGKRRATSGVSSGRRLPAANSSAKAERSAIEHVRTIERLPSASIPAQAGKRRAPPKLRSKFDVPAATPSAQAEHSAVEELQPQHSVPSAFISAQAGKRRAIAGVKSSKRLLAADHSALAEGPQATIGLPTKHRLPAAQKLTTKNNRDACVS